MSVKLSFWNVRGLNDPAKHNPFIDWLSSHKPLFVALLETHVKEPFLNPLISLLCPGWNHFSNHLSDPDGRIILIWRDPLKVRILRQSRQCITCVITLPNQPALYYSAVYASNLSEDRSDLWVELLQTHSDYDLHNNCWIVGGDLNQIMYHYEHSSREVCYADSLMYELQNCLSQAGLFDLRYLGTCHTWTNKQPTDPIAKKLDRLLINSPLISALPQAVASFHPTLTSDHTPCILDLAFTLPKAGTYPYKFQNYLTKHPKFAEVIREAWFHAESLCQTLTQLCWKLKQIKRDLKLLNRENYSQIQERVNDTYSLLKHVQVRALADPTPQTFQEERDLHQKWLFLREIEEAYFRQKSRINWLAEGDLNTSYFHRICQVRASINAIRAFLTDAGDWIYDPLEMSMHAVAHFQSVLAPMVLFRSPTSTDARWFHELQNYRVSSDQALLMETVPSSDEIRSLMFKLNPKKSPDPDGLTSGFFKAAWDVLGAEVIGAVKHFFLSGFLPATANATILTLVPKFPGATKISEFRPIACLNTIYKLISRLLVRRLKPILQQLILPSQTAFVKGRLIVENSVLASELVNGYHKNRGSKRITIKVDIAKAFDTLSWDFLFACLEGLHMPAQFLRRLKACICTPSFMLGYNGTVNGYFKGKRGLRQGDPMSPYLFVIAMNCLSHMLNKVAEQNRMGYHAKCRKTKLTNLSFADDLLIFTDGSIESVQCVLQVLRDFEERSGLVVSMQKTSFFASGLSDEEVSTIQASTGMVCGALPVRYLGVPLCSKKLSLTNCEPLLQQIKAKFSSWSVKSLSFSGRHLLIKTVIAGINTFWCSAFILPKACIIKINSMCSTFLWKGDVESHNSARVAWSTAVLTKEQGGLGIKDLQIWNLACCLRLI